MLRYPLKLTVPAKLLTPVLELLEGEGISVEIGRAFQEPQAEPPVRRSTKVRKLRCVPGGRGTVVLLRCAAAAHRTRPQALADLIDAGFLPTSAHAAVMKAIRSGYVMLTANNVLLLTPKGKELWSTLEGKSL